MIKYKVDLECQYCKTVVYRTHVLRLKRPITGQQTIEECLVCFKSRYQRYTYVYSDPGVFVQAKCE